MPGAFWAELDELIAKSRLVIDRPINTPHPQNRQHVYPLDYGYLEGTTTVDGDGIDVWVGSSDNRSLVGLICTIDGLKSEMEVKLLIGCSPADVARIEEFFTKLNMSHITMWRDAR